TRGWFAGGLRSQSKRGALGDARPGLRRRLGSPSPLAPIPDAAYGLIRATPLRSPGKRGAPRPCRARALARPDASPRAAESPPGRVARVSEAHPGHTFRTATTHGNRPSPRPNPDAA